MSVEMYRHGSPLPHRMTPSDTPASAANPLARAFTTIESVGHEHPEYRVATIKMRFEGDGAAERAHAALNYLSRLHEGASPPASAAKGEGMLGPVRTLHDLIEAAAVHQPVVLPQSVARDLLGVLMIQPQPSQQAARVVGTIAHVSNGRSELPDLVYAALTSQQAGAEVTKALKAWVREDCSTGLKMMMTPKTFCDLETRILAALTSEAKG